MASQSPKKLSSIQLIELISGPRVDVYIGPSKEHYSLPKNLLCYYSKFFDRCFNNVFEEGQTQKLELPEDTVEDFDILLEYMTHTTVSSSAKVVSAIEEDAFDHCIAFLQYIDKYDMKEVTIAVHDSMEKIIKNRPSNRRGAKLATGNNIEIVFSTTSPCSLLRDLIVNTALSEKGIIRVLSGPIP
ncbi:hypothetical protein EG329_009488 [Mollisiaceae sp. DMI_Dod_QoI]|nr:hypothetical protein EG329_009488 [Helotiales sp. DMI_Dod_QoI]